MFVMLVTLSGCNTPKALPSATALPPTAQIEKQATQTLAPVRNTPAAATPTERIVEATEPPVPPRIVILEPGRGSRVATAKVSGQSEPTFEQHLGIRISGEDGTLVGEGYTTINAEMGMRGSFEAEIFFSVDREQSGRISVFDTSARDGGLMYLTSVLVTLIPDLAAGVQVLPADNLVSFFRIDQPPAYGEVSGGMLHVEGLSGPAFENTIIVTLCGEGGSGARELICGTEDNVLVTVPVTIQSADIGQPGTFSVDIPYAVSQETFARVAVYVLSPMDGGIIELNSVEVLLRP